jgi:hypothetical protein
MSDKISASVFTALFQMDLRKFNGNPFHVDTTFGRATAICAGDLFETNRLLELRILVLVALAIGAAGSAYEIKAALMLGIAIAAYLLGCIDTFKVLEGIMIKHRAEGK